jgi:hypothetical protein
MKTYPLLCRKLPSRYTQVFRNRSEVWLFLNVPHLVLHVVPKALQPATIITQR